MNEAGYSGTPLAKKLGLKDNQTVLLVNQPKYYSSLFSVIPEIKVVKKNAEEIDVIHFFADNRQNFEATFNRLSKQIKKDGMIWVSWPKKASKVKTDLNENLIRDVGLSLGLVDVKVCAVDDVWSGLKFVYRLSDR